MLDLITFLAVLIAVGFIGSTIEKNHYKKIRKREVALFKFPYVSMQKKMVSSKRQVLSAKFVSGCAVISSDYFKDALANLKEFFGGKVTSYESLLDRARREATLRMRENAYGADIIINTKLEALTLNTLTKDKNPVQVCVFAYGTAIKYEKR